MKIDLTKIDGYADMTAEEKLAALEGFEFDEPKADNTEILKLKNALNKASSDVADFKKQLREKQTEAERAEAERLEKETERENLLKTLLRDRDVANYQTKFLETGYSPELAKSSAEAMANADFETIFANLTAFNQAKEKEIRASVLKGTPSPVAGGTTDKTVTKEQFDSMGYAERLKLFNESPEVYQELNT